MNERKHFNKIAKHYYEMVDAVWYDNGYYHQQELEFVLGAFTHLESNSLRILDAGCGPGRHTIALAKQCHHIVALDFSENMLEITQASARVEGVATRVAFVQSDIRVLPFAAQSFDGIICMEVLEHLPSRLEDAEVALREFHRVLQNNGVLLVEAPLRPHGHLCASHPYFRASWKEVGPEVWAKYREAPLETWLHFDEEEVLELLGYCGFCLMEKKYVRIIPAGLIEHYPMLEAIDKVLEWQPGAQKLAREAIWLAQKTSAPSKKQRHQCFSHPKVEMTASAETTGALAQELEDMLWLLAEVFSERDKLAEKEREWEQTRKAHEQTYRQLIAVGEELAQERHHLAAEREAHGQTYKQLLSMGDELVQVRQQLAEKERQLIAHQTVLTAVQAELQQARAEATQWRSRFETVVRSRSYRMMEPVRRIYWELRNGQARLRGLYQAGRQAGWSIVRTLSQRVLPPPLKRRAKQFLQWQSLCRDSRPWRAQLRQILAAHPDAKGVILYPPTLDWNFMFQRPQQLARAFARAGYLFLYCTENARVDCVHGFQPVEKNLFVCHVPWQTFADLQQPIVLISWAAHRSLLDVFSRCTVIYDCLDDLEVGGARVEDHEALLQKADIILATSWTLVEQIKPKRPDVLFCPNAADHEFFAQAQTAGRMPMDLQPILRDGKPVIGYHGALAKWFDYKLVGQTAQAMPDFSFVLVGVDYDGTIQRSGLLKRPNVFWLGLKPYQELPDYLRWFTVGTVPFLLNRVTEATSPIKVWEYLAAGKPVVSTDLPMCRGIEGIWIARSLADFCQKIQQVLQLVKDPTLRARMEQVARANTWEARVAQIVAALQERLG